MCWKAAAVFINAGGRGGCLWQSSSSNLSWNIGLGRVQKINRGSYRHPFPRPVDRALVPKIVRRS